MILCGFFSLCERKILALFQLRIGPGLFLNGVLTPITDGIKLLFKNILLIISVDFFYLLINIIICINCLYIIIFVFPIGFIILFDINISIFFILSIHIIANIIGIYIVGCYVFCSCYVYMAAMRTLFFNILSEGLILIIFIQSFLIEYFSFFSIKDITICQLFINNIIILGFIFTMLILIAFLLDGSRLPFDYIECESELVAGLITEFSGFFFVIYSLIEINHTLLNSIMIVCLLFGGYYVCFKSLFVLFFVFLVPRSLCCRMKVSNAQCLILNYMYIIGLFTLSSVAAIKIILISII